MLAKLLSGHITAVRSTDHQIGTLFAQNAQSIVSVLRKNYIIVCSREPYFQNDTVCGNLINDENAFSQSGPITKVNTVNSLNAKNVNKL